MRSKCSFMVLALVCCCWCMDVVSCDAVPGEGIAKKPFLSRVWGKHNNDNNDNSNNKSSDPIGSGDDDDKKGDDDESSNTTKEKKKKSWRQVRQPALSQAERARLERQKRQEERQMKRKEKKQQKEDAKTANKEEDSSSTQPKETKGFFGLGRKKVSNNSPEEPEASSKDDISNAKKQDQQKTKPTDTAEPAKTEEAKEKTKWGWRGNKKQKERDDDKKESKDDASTTSNKEDTKKQEDPKAEKEKDGKNDEDVDTSASKSNTVVPTEADLFSANNNQLANFQRQPTAYVVRVPPPGGQPPGGQPQMYRSSNQAVALTALLSLTGVIARLWIVVWITKKLAMEEETIHPIQHFVWECLNDRHTKDDTVLTKVLEQVPEGFGKRKWKKYIHQTRTVDKKEQKNPIQMPSKTVVVVDVTPNQQLDLTYLSDVVNFLVRAHGKRMFGDDPEIVLLLRSPGGEVTKYGLAAAQVARLQAAGLFVTTCVDNVAASGGYMVASQSSQIVAAPFAIVGSIGVIRESLNYNKILNNYGIKPLVIKAGEMKNPLSSLGPVTDKELKDEEERLLEVHKAFIDLCLSRRPTLDAAMCDGRVMIGNLAMRSGMIDRTLTSDEYIYEKLREGAYVLKLHKSTKENDRVRVFARAMDLLPHLKQRIAEFKLSSGLNIHWILQGAALASMIHRAILQRK